MRRGFDEAGQASGQPAVAEAPLALSFDHQHGRTLAAARNELGQSALRASGRDRGSGRTAAAKRAITSASIASVFTSTARLGVMAHLCRVDHHKRQAGPGEGSSRHCFKAAGCLEATSAGASGRSLAINSSRPSPLRPTKGLSGPVHRHVEPILRDVDTDIDPFHGHPAFNRARPDFAVGAARATGRGHGHNGRGTTLPHGLHAPRLHRFPVRHCTGNHSQCGKTCLSTTAGFL